MLKFDLVLTPSVHKRDCGPQILYVLFVGKLNTHDQGPHNGPACLRT